MKKFALALASMLLVLSAAECGGGCSQQNDDRCDLRVKAVEIVKEAGRLATMLGHRGD